MSRFGDMCGGCTVGGGWGTSGAGGSLPDAIPPAQRARVRCDVAHARDDDDDDDRDEKHSV